MGALAFFILLFYFILSGTTQLAMRGASHEWLCCEIQLHGVTLPEMASTE